MKITKTITHDGIGEETIRNVAGAAEANLKVISHLLGADVSCRDGRFFVEAKDEQTVAKAEEVLSALVALSSSGRMVSESDVAYAARKAKRNEKADFSSYHARVAGRLFSGKLVTAKTEGQLRLLEEMERNVIVFALGPAGTGKTFLAVVHAVTALKKGEVKRIVLTRPAVEAGENLGFLPGDLKEKVDPYLTPLYDSLNDMLGKEQMDKLLERGSIEIAPLAYMRGRTLNDAYVILDEAQNTTASQMKMFLTRLGFNSRMVITGDITQIDLDHRQQSGLVHAAQLLEGIESIAIIRLDADDVVRHPLVQKIIERYGRDEKQGG